jgi:hypothetical protein
MCFVWISEQTATFALHSTSRLVLYNRSGVFTARYALGPYIKQTCLFFEGLSHLLPIMSYVTHL